MNRINFKRSEAAAEDSRAWMVEDQFKRKKCVSIFFSGKSPTLILEIKKVFLIGLFLSFVGLYAFSAHGQPVQRSVLYETSTYKTYAVACNVDTSLLSELDWVYLEVKPTTKNQ